MFAHGARPPVLKRPSDVGLDYEDAFFPSLDGVPLEAWFVPADSDKLLMVNHPMVSGKTFSVAVLRTEELELHPLSFLELLWRCASLARVAARH